MPRDRSAIDVRHLLVLAGLGLAAGCGGASGDGVVTSPSTDTPADTTTDPVVTGPAAPTLRAGVAKTGQSSSFSLGDDGDLQAGIAWPAARFSDNGDGTITDGLTGLMWAQDAGLGAGAMAWTDALAFASGLSHAGYADWRLPNVNELESLIDYEQANPSLPLGSPFQNVHLNVFDETAGAYWSSTPVLTASGQPTASLGKSFVTGRTVALDQAVGRARAWVVRGVSDGGAVRLARTGWTTSVAAGDDGALAHGLAWPQPRFTDHGDGTVTDELTGLMWCQDAGLGGPMPWQGALDAVAADNAAGLNGYADWRLPNARELRSLVDYSHKEAPLPTAHPFANVAFSFYWTSTSLVVDPTRAGVVSMGLASDVRSFDGKATNAYWVWRVRGQTTTEAPAPAPTPAPTPEPDPEPTPAPDPDPVVVTVGALWAPNHKMVELSACLDDAPEGAVAARVVDVSSDEGDVDDWTIVDDLTVQLRGERDGNGDGRTYAITVEVTLEDGQTATGVGLVFVPHDQRAKTK